MRLPGPRSLAGQLFAMQVVLVAAIVAGCALFSYVTDRHQAEEAARRQAIATATSVAASPAVVEAARTKNPTPALQPYAETLRTTTGVDFVVVMAPDGTRWTHPVLGEIGKKYLGDTAPALRGKTFTETLHGGARAFRTGRGAGHRPERSWPDHRARQRGHHHRQDQRAGAEAGGGAGRHGGRRARARRARHLRDQRAAAPPHARHERRRAEPHARLPPGHPARGARGAAHAGRGAADRADQRRRARAARARRGRGGPPGGRARPARPAHRGAPRLRAEGATRST